MNERRIKPWAAVALVLLAALNLAGCSCNTTNTFDQRYCESYSGTTVVPAVAIGAAFFALTFLVWQLTWRRDRAEPGDKAVGLEAPPVARPTDGGACASLEQLIASGAIEGRVLEGYDSRWIVELTFGAGQREDPFVTSWTSREAACQEALEELERRGSPTRGERAVGHG